MHAYFQTSKPILQGKEIRKWTIHRGRNWTDSNFENGDKRKNREREKERLVDDN